MAIENSYPVVIGTAGHIDHGKTTLVKALTGQDADRLPEEKRRGITIDLGFAHMPLPSGRHLAFIDVPGHERFIRNMVAGVHGMDAVLLVVAADEGVMPQTVEHLAILRLLGVRRGLTVITKADLVDDEMLELVQSLVSDAVHGTFLQDAPLLVVDAVSGRGIPPLLRHLEEIAGGVKRNVETGAARLPIDRVFSVKGFGTVVTGTLVSGRIAVDEAVEAVPLGRTVRVRGLQVHNQSVAMAWSGQRVAVNLAGVERGDIRRGDVLASPGTLSGVELVAVELELIAGSPAVVDGIRVHVHAGTDEALARVYLFEGRELQAGERAFVELRLEAPLALKRWDHFLVRAYSPVFTIGGGIVLEVGHHHRRREEGLLEHWRRLRDGDDVLIAADLLRHAQAPLEAREIASRLGLVAGEEGDALARVPSACYLDGGYVWDLGCFQKWVESMRSGLSAYLSQRPIKPGMPIEEAKTKFAVNWPTRLFRGALERAGIIFDREWIRLDETPAQLADGNLREVERVYQAIRDQGLKPESLEAIHERLRVATEQFDDIVERLFLEGRLLRLEDGLAISLHAYQQGRDMIVGVLREKGRASTGELKEVLGVGRRLAVLFLELLDRERVTRRLADSRELVG